jgi:hypothetical protein
MRNGPATVMSERRGLATRSTLSMPSTAAWTITGVAIALIVAEVWLASGNGTGSPAQVVNLALILNAVVGAIVVSRHPRDEMGWILCDAVADAINLWEGALRQQLQGAAR